MQLVCQSLSDGNSILRCEIAQPSACQIEREVDDALV